MPVKLKHVILKTGLNQKQATAHSSKEHEKCACDEQFEADTIQEEITRLLDQFNVMQEENSDITSELSNMVAKHVGAWEEILKLDTMDS